MINSMKYLCSCSPIPCSVTDFQGSRLLNPAMKSLLGFVGDEDSVGLESSHGIEVFAAQENRCFERKSPFLAVNSLPYGSEQKMQPWIFYFFPLPAPVYEHDEVDAEYEFVGTFCHAHPLLFSSAFDLVKGEAPRPATFEYADGVFTHHDMKVIFFTLHGLSSKETARYLGISHRTVENRLQGIYQKSGVNSSRELAAYCRDAGIDRYIPPGLLSEDSYIFDYGDAA